MKQAALWVVGVGLLAVVAVGRYRREDEDLARAMGSAFGAVLVALLISGVGFAIARRIRKQEGPQSVTPGLLIVAGLIGFLSLVGTDSRERDEVKAGLERVTRKGEAACPPDEPPVFARLGDGLRYQSVDPADLGPAEALARGPFRIRRVLEGDTIVGIVTVATLDDFAGFQRGIVESVKARDPDARRKDVRLGSRRLAARTYTYGPPPGVDDVDQSQLIVASGCRSYAIVSGDVESAVGVAEAVLGDARVG